MSHQLLLVTLCLVVAAPGSRSQIVGSCLADQTFSGSKTDHQGSDVATADFDGDGLSDLLAAGGIHPSDNVVRLYRGHTGQHLLPCEVPPTVEFTGITTGSSAMQWSLNVAFLGDVNGLGKRDIAIGAPREAGGLGEVYVFWGESFSGTPAGCGPCQSTCTGTMQVPVGMADVTITGTLGHGRFGADLASGDFDGDGAADDLVVGQPGAFSTQFPAPSFAGLVRKFTSADLMSSTTLNDSQATHTTRGVTPGDRFGFSLANAGRIDADLVDDLMVGAIQAVNVGPSVFTDWQSVNGGPGYVRALRGVNLREIYTIQPTAPLFASLRQFGFSVAVTPDFDGDSVKDILVGAPGFKVLDGPGSSVRVETGAAFVYSGATGAASGGAIFPEGLPGFGDPAYGAPFESLFGWSVAGGDHDGDGFGDLWIGVPRYRADSSQWQGCPCPGGLPACEDTVGEVWVRRGFDQASLVQFRGHYGLADKQRMGWSVAVGDVDGNGNDDTITGALAQSLPAPAGGEDGRVYVFLQ